jgi:hypothetical protein
LHKHHATGDDAGTKQEDKHMSNNSAKRFRIDLNQSAQGGGIRTIVDPTNNYGRILKAWNGLRRDPAAHEGAMIIAVDDEQPWWLVVGDDYPGNWYLSSEFGPISADAIRVAS